MCEAVLSKQQEEAGILARNSHTSVASDWTYHFFSRVKTIVHSSDWLELICVSNLQHNVLVSISQYVCIKNSTMLSLSAFELYSRWVPLFCVINTNKNGLQIMSLAAYATKTNQHKYFRRNYTLLKKKKNMQKLEWYIYLVVQYMSVTTFYLRL